MPRSPKHTTALTGDEPQTRAAVTAEPLPLEGTGAGLPASMLAPRQLRAVIESLLFVAGRPLAAGELRRLLVIDEKRLREALDGLAEECERQGRGIRVQRAGDTVQIVSAPENARFVAALLGLPAQAKLTTAALETLAVVAYRQPITRSQIEFIRGVNSDRALASLIQYGLAQEVGRAATIGRPALFGTTPEFLQQFGLSSLDALPKPEAPELEAIAAGREAAARTIREAVGGDDDEPVPSA
ncbi:MAG TPA: SMC-Scp complex subunit ScpB [Ktedonobacterales bacterium]|nr:SMC-Scp complex subunit ScpB [Ktedonobacterales bacterium]